MRKSRKSSSDKSGRKSCPSSSLERAKTGGAASRSAICVCVVRMSYKHTSRCHCHDIFLHITVIPYIYILCNISHILHSNPLYMLLTFTVVGTSQLQVAQPLQTTSPSCLQVSKITSVAVGKITSLSWFSSPTTRPMTTTIPIGEDPLKTSMFTWPKWVILLVALISTYPYHIKIYSLQICKRLQECSSECP